MQLMLVVSSNRVAEVVNKRINLGFGERHRTLEKEKAWQVLEDQLRHLRMIRLEART